MTVRVSLKPRRAQPLFARHPWVFAQAIARVEGKPQPGDAVVVYSHKGEFVAHGLFNPHSKIRIRLYSWHEDRPIDEALLRERIRQAVRFRHQTLGLDGPRAGARLIFSESDLLSGLIVDRFADVLTVQLNAHALMPHESIIVDELMQVARPRCLFRRVDPRTCEREGMTQREELIVGELPNSPVIVEDAGVEWIVEPTSGQKTGAYLDQRENRHAVARYASNRDVLDVFCYSAGFSIVALKNGRAHRAAAVDSSDSALALAARNAERNGVALEAIQGDAGQVMQRLHREGRSFGLVTCDPPKFAHQFSDIEAALKGYEHINRLALSLVQPGGILASCSCSGLISPEMFLEVLRESARKEGRDVRLLEMRGQSADHPIALACPETGYLKCAILSVGDAI